MRNTRMRGTSPILITAALSVAGLLAAGGMHLGSLFGRDAVIAEAGEMVPIEPRAYLEAEDGDGNGVPDWQDELARSGIAIATSTDESATSSDPVEDMDVFVASALYGGYLSLKRYDDYSITRGETLGLDVASKIRAPKTFAPHTVEELSIGEETSPDDILEYRSKMQVALESMVTEEPPEFELFAYYLDTQDRSWLAKLAEAAARYRTAELNALEVKVPKDAAPEHLRVVNSIGEYATTLERLSQYGTDTFASVALLKSLNEGEEELVRSFDLLADYYVRTAAN